MELTATARCFDIDRKQRIEREKGLLLDATRPLEDRVARGASDVLDGAQHDTARLALTELELVTVGGESKRSGLQGSTHDGNHDPRVEEPEEQADSCLVPNIEIDERAIVALQVQKNTE